MAKLTELADSRRFVMTVILSQCLLVRQDFFGYGPKRAGSGDLDRCYKWTDRLDAA